MPTGHFRTVCAGLARRYGVPVFLVRVLMVAAGISGSGITLYPVLWVLMPKEGLIARPMASAELNQRVEKVVGYPPLCDMDDFQRREFHEALLEADAFEDLPGKWQAAILKAERSRPRLRRVSDL